MITYNIAFEFFQGQAKLSSSKRGILYIIDETIFLVDRFTLKNILRMFYKLDRYALRSVID